MLAHTHTVGQSGQLRMWKSLGSLWLWMSNHNRINFNVPQRPNLPWRNPIFVQWTCANPGLVFCPIVKANYQMIHLSKDISRQIEGKNSWIKQKTVRCLIGTTILSPMFGHFQKQLWQKRMAKVDAFQATSCICWYHSSAALKFWVLHAIDRGQLQISFTKEDVSQFDGAHRLFLIFGPAVTLDTGRILGIPRSKVSIFNRKLNTPQIKNSSCEICFGNTCSIMELKKGSPGPTQNRLSGHGYRCLCLASDWKGESWLISKQS